MQLIAQDAVLRKPTRGTHTEQQTEERVLRIKVASTERDNAQEGRGKAEHRQSKDEKKQQEFYRQWWYKLLYQSNCKII